MERVVFVDPQEQNEKYWWIALIVKEEDYDLFFKEMGERIPLDKEFLVCYFEDGSYSCVGESEIKSFDFNSEPYVLWSSDKIFLRDKSYKLATSYLLDGKIPPKFKWLKRKNKVGNLKKGSKEEKTTNTTASGNNKVRYGNKSKTGDAFNIPNDKSENNLNEKVVHKEEKEEGKTKKKIWKERASEKFKKGVNDSFSIHKK
ncbi:uncharacterized protein LOC114937325 [Nylanderia fulva]|uniref:uncharacterized protein LOC114937325 n=1 Tax=Nylanderia fulva TaxID=613905 RepID=UPI0010FB2CE1|nr:uncharacterized protein LOC114937325 [Nylanderia fulva]